MLLNNIAFGGFFQASEIVFVCVSLAYWLFILKVLELSSSANAPEPAHVNPELNVSLACHKTAHGYCCETGGALQSFQPSR